MNAKAIISMIGKGAQKLLFQTKKNSPTILVIAGTVGVVVSAVIACRETTKIGEILDKHKEDVDTIKEYAAREDKPEEYSDDDKRHDLTIVYANTGKNLVKLYAPAVLLGAASIVSILTSHKILGGRYASASAALMAATTGFKEYRNRVIERFGEEIDKELRYNVKSQQIEEKTVDDEGNEKTATRMVDVANPNVVSDYCKFFDEYSPCWEKDADYNLTFLKAQERYANDKLRSQGHLYLNEVYDMLGIPRTKAGQIVGWVYDPDNPIGDNYVSFGIYDKAQNRAFVNGHERSILLDFNVDGNILDLMDAGPTKLVKH